MAEVLCMPGRPESPLNVPDEILYQLNTEKGLSYTEIGKLFNLTRGQVAGRIHRYKRQAGKQDTRELFEVIDFGQPLSLSGDWLIVGDVHVPATDYDFAGLVTLVALHEMEEGQRNLLVAGDMLNADSFSRYEQFVTPPTFSQELKAARALISEWLEVFDRVVFLIGNHERRFIKKLEGALETTDFYAMLTGNPKATFSAFGWCVIDTPTGRWRVTHPRNYSVNQLRVASDLAIKFQQHIIAHHEHHFGIGWDKY
ncbi:hypothetical protein D6833_04345, partial [Candidatus Parcubacteria bacterium]